MNIIDGLHLIVDGNVSDPALFSEENLDAMFKELVAELRMDLIYGPIFKQVEVDPAKLTGDKFRDEGGVSAYAMISTSHISMHCWPLRRTFMGDIFSCTTFSHELAMNVIESHLKPSGLKTRMLVRRPDVVL
jgi:S-adenosylmethionine/arginine decarboxylase-like enzyme